MHTRTPFTPLFTRLGLLAALGFAALSTQAQVAAPTWASVVRANSSSGANDGSRANEIAVAPDGSQYVCGVFEGTFTIGSTTLAAGAGNGHLFLVKLNPNGTVAWARQANTTSGDTDVSVAVDPAGNAYLTGYFSGSLSFPGAPGTLTTANGVTDAYVAKLDSQGNLLWAIPGGVTGGNSAYATGIAADASGNVYVSGDFAGSIGFGGASTVSASNSDVFLCKLSATNGAQVWIRKGGSNGSDFGYALTTDAAGNPYLGGVIRQPAAIFGSVTLPAGTGAVNDEDIFVAKFDPQGNTVWAQRAGTANNDGVSDVAVDASGNVAITGYVNGVFTSTSDASEIYVARFSATGAPQWSRRIVPTAPDYYQGQGVAFDNRGGLYVTGYFESSVTFGTTTLTANTQDVFVVRYDGLGNAIWANRAGGTTANDAAIAFDVATDAGGNAYLAGGVLGTVSFGSVASTGTGIGFFVSKLNAGGTITATRAAADVALQTYPNPADDYTKLALPAGGGRLALTDALGRTVREQTLPQAAGTYRVALAGLAPGLYHLRATLGNGQTAVSRVTVR
ncbi:SBBP repeat-containing protein [Hymenobacter busanensis]|nr:SBBP repeat-containing protein [Hymenobacter busanensis]QHJ09235.1 T9SS type A sorting domain-containing protein [Hymenobacter busanensis]